VETWNRPVSIRPGYALTDGRGKFSLTVILPGTYRVLVRHPYLRESSAHDVTIRFRESTALTVTIAAPTGRPFADQTAEHS
jgi:hypothetical protein